MSIPNAIRIIDQEPATDWRIWSHDDSGLLEIGLDTTGEGEGYYYRLLERLKDPSVFSFKALSRFLDSTKPAWIDQEEALKLRDEHDKGWRVRPDLKLWATAKFLEGAMSCDDRGGVTGLFPSISEADKTDYGVTISPQGRFTLIKRYSRAQRPRHEVGEARVVKRAYKLDRVLPFDIHVAWLDNDSVDPRPIIDGDVVDYINHAVMVINSRAAA